MRYVGVDLHKRSVVMPAEDEHGRRQDSGRFDSQDRPGIVRFFENLKPFRCVIEASCRYRWFHELISPLGEVILAHPLRLRAIVTGRAKTDKLDAALLARLLRAGLIPEAYIPPRSYQELRDLARARARLSQQATSAACELHAMLTRRNIRMPFANVFSKSAQRWLAGLELPGVDGFLRDELTARIRHYRGEMAKLDVLLEEMSARFPEHEALTVLHGVGLYSAMLIIGEMGEPARFADGRQVGAYAGLTARVSQSGEQSRHGHITRQGSPWLRWILVEAAWQAIRHDAKLRSYYERVRRNDPNRTKIAVVATAHHLLRVMHAMLRTGEVWRSAAA